MIQVGKLTIGGETIPVQTMLKNPVTDIDLTLEKLRRLARIGCDMIRITVPDEKVIPALKTVLRETPMPVVADIHFDYRLAILAIEAGVHKVRINPGNIGGEDKVREVIRCLKDHQIPVRIGINGGSLPAHLKEKYRDPVTVMIESAREELRYFEKYGYDQVLLSFKSSNVMETIRVNRLAEKEFGLPLHIGVTEAGDFMDGTVKNSVGIGALLLDGIGDTIRVSLTSSEENEVIIGKRILEACGRRIPEWEVVSCPTCGRTEVSIESIVTDLKNRMKTVRLRERVKIAVMGCVVNGPGEAEGADFGVACGKGQSLLFKQGKKLKTVKNESILDELLILLEDYYDKD